jgi:transposase
LADGEIVSRIERRRKWTAEEKAALLAEVEAEGGKVAVVARRHRISDSLLYNWRSAWRAATAVAPTATAMEFVPLGVIGPTDDEHPAMLTPPVPEQPRSGMTERVGGIEVELPNGARIRVDAFVNEKALARVFRAMKGAL